MAVGKVGLGPLFEIFGGVDGREDGFVGSLTLGGC